jgi:tetratricopeptide (TPR) repeat protein
VRTPELFKYNPRQCPPGELEATFVARDDVLGSILDELRARAAEPANQHFLIIGPRGIGKTNLLIMVRLRVEADPELARAYLPLQTVEEEYSVAGLRDLLVRVLELVAERGADHALQDAMSAVSAESDDSLAVEEAIEVLRRYHGETGRKLLLLVDNLDLILGDQFSDDTQLGRLRDLLMNEGFLVLIGAAPTHFEEVSGYDRPLYNFFRVVPLRELTVEEMEELLARRAREDDNEELLGRVRGSRARLEALHHLTGGSPRLVLMLYQLCTHTELPEVRAAIRMILDDLTPYYKARLEGLSPQQRKVMDTFARLGRPATPTEIAAEARLEVNSVNTALQRLRERGFVSVAQQARRRSTLYVVRERIFRIWHQMRFSADRRRRLEFLIDFIRIWYERPEWRAETARLLAGYRATAEQGRLEEAGRYVDHLDYMSAAAPEADWAVDLDDRVVRECMESGDYDRADALIDQRLAETRETERRAELWGFRGRCWHRAGDPAAAAEAFGRALSLDPASHEAANNWGNALSDAAVLERDAGEGARARELFAESFSKYELALSIKGDSHEAANNWGTALLEAARLERDAGERGRARELFAESFSKYELALSIKEDKHEAAYNWGNALIDGAVLERDAGEGGRARELFAESFSKYELALSIKEDSHEAATNWGTALLDAARLERDAGEGARARELFAESFSKYELALSIKEDDHEAANNWGGALAELAAMEQGAEADSLLHDALVRIGRAAELARRDAPDQVGFYSAHFVHVALGRCGRALAEGNEGTAREMWSAAVDRLPEARPDLARTEVVLFLTTAASPGSARACGEMLEELDGRGLGDLRGLLDPFAKAFEYWQGGRDAEVLDRLNPEVREIVEQIVRGGEGIEEQDDDSREPG